MPLRPSPSPSDCFSGKTCCSELEARRTWQGGRRQGTSQVRGALSLPPAFLPPCSRWTRRLVMFFPGVGEAADGFPEAYGKFGNRFQALDGARRKPVAPGEQQFRVT